MRRHIIPHLGLFRVPINPLLLLFSGKGDSALSPGRRLREGGSRGAEDQRGDEAAQRPAERLRFRLSGAAAGRNDDARMTATRFRPLMADAVGRL